MSHYYDFQDGTGECEITIEGLTLSVPRVDGGWWHLVPQSVDIRRLRPENSDLTFPVASYLNYNGYYESLQCGLPLRRLLFELREKAAAFGTAKMATMDIQDGSDRKGHKLRITTGLSMATVRQWIDELYAEFNVQVVSAASLQSCLDLSAIALERKANFHINSYMHFRRLFDRNAAVRGKYFNRENVLRFRAAEAAETDPELRAVNRTRTAKYAFCAFVWKHVLPANLKARYHPIVVIGR